MITRCLMGVAVSPWLLFLSLSARGDGGMGPAIMAGLTHHCRQTEREKLSYHIFSSSKQVGCRAVCWPASLRRLCAEHYVCINAAQILNDANRKIHTEITCRARRLHLILETE